MSFICTLCLYLRDSFIPPFCRVFNSYSVRQRLLSSGALSDERKALLKNSYLTIDFHFARKKLLLSDSLADKEKTLLRKVSLKVHRNDNMIHRRDGFYLDIAQHYLSIGLFAVRCIENAFKQSSEKYDVRSILDFACGHGRVLRFLRAKFPKADITACEIDPEALHFCKRTFFVKTILSQKDFTKLSLLGRFELIWCGSLLTHIDEKAATNLLKLFHDHLSPGGLCIFTTHGQTSAKWIQDKRKTYALSSRDQQQVLSQFRECGYGYAEYEHQPGYGISVVSHDRMLSIARGVGPWKETYYLERGWDNHQDVYGFTGTSIK